MANVVVIGAPCIDEYYRWDYFPKLGDKINSHFLKAVPGGFTANAACVIGSLGNECHILCDLGRDEYAHVLLETLEKGGVKTDYVRVSASSRTLKLPIMMVGPEKLILIPIYDDCPPYEYDESRMALLRSADCVYSSISDLRRRGNEDRIVNEIKAAGVRLMLDAESSTFTSYESERFFFDAADILSFNDFSLEKFTGCTGEMAENKIAEFIGESDKIVLMTLGDKGCIIRARSGRTAIPILPVPVVDTTGAGDTFNGAFLHRILGGASVEAAGRFAAAAAARCITIMDPRAGAVSEATVRDFMRANDWKE